jgi:hypothetical protein
MILASYPIHHYYTQLHYMKMNILDFNITPIFIKVFAIL